MNTMLFVIIIFGAVMMWLFAAVSSDLRAYHGLESRTTRSALSDEVKKDLQRRMITVAAYVAVLFLMNLAVSLLAKSSATSIIGIVLAVVYFLELFAEILDEKGGRPLIWAHAYFAIPMAVNVVLCRAELAGYKLQLQTVKSFALALLVPLIATIIFVVFRLAAENIWPRLSEANVPCLTGLFSRVAKRRDRDDSDEFEDISSDSHSRGAANTNWIYILCATLVVVTIAVCAAIILK